MRYFKLLVITLITTGSLMTISCKDTTKSHDLAPLSENTKVEITEEDKKEIDAFAEELTRTINEGDNSFFADRFDILKLGELALTGLDLSEEEKRGARNGLNRNLPASKQQLLQVIGTSHIKFIKFVHETRPALLYRLIMEDESFTYCEFILDKRAADKKWEIVDLFMYANGKRTSEVMRDGMAQMLPNSGKFNQVMLDAMEKIQDVANLNHSGNYQKAWDTWETINPKAHTNRIVLMQGYMAAFQLYNVSIETTAEITEPLLKVVSIMEKQFPGDAGLAIMQLGVHEINKDAKKYRETVQKIRDKVGEDPFLDLVEASADLIDGNNELFLKKAMEFQAVEPDTFYTYPYIWGGLLEKQDYKTLSSSLDEFITRFEADASLFFDDEDFKLFYDSPEGKAWLEKHKK